MTYTEFVASLKKVLIKIGITGKYTGHSFRRGGATFALQSGVSGDFIKLLGDWHSDAYHLYLDLSLQRRVQALSQLVTCLPK